MEMAKFNKEDRQLQQEVDESLRVSSYLGEVAESLKTGQPVREGIVPDFSDGQSGGSRPSFGSQSTPNESGSLFSLDYSHIMGQVDGLEKIASSVQVPETAVPPGSSRGPSIPKLKISRNQWTALQKFPALVELLGTVEGEKIAQQISTKVNDLLVINISANSREINKYAGVCVSEDQNIKQYFVGKNESWACCVISSGPFRGDEAVFYNQDTNQSSILRKDGSDYINVTSQFNVVHQYAEKTEGEKNEK